MRVKHKLLLFFAMMALGTLLMAGVAATWQFRAMERAAKTEAAHTADIISHSVAPGSPGSKPPLTGDRNRGLQALVNDVKSRLHYDVVILDQRKTIIADADAQNLLKFYQHDSHNEVSKTLRDGNARTFTLAGPDPQSPAVLRKIVVPLKKEGNRALGALVLDYTPIYESHFQRLHLTLGSLALIGLVCLGLASLCGYLGIRTIARPLGELRDGVESLARGDLGARIEAKPRGELGHLTTAFNRMSRDLKDSRDRLLGNIQELEQNHREFTLLAKMGDDLKGCRPGEEAYGIIAGTLGDLFSGDSGALFVFKKSKNLLEAAGTWGEAPPPAQVFAPSDCCGMRRGQAHVSSPGPGYLRCKHVHESGRGCLCMPVATQFEEMGLLQVLAGAAGDPGPDWLKTRQNLAQRVSERLGQELTDLKMNEELRNQSLRDPLTGMYNRRYMEESLERELFRAARHGAPLAVIMLDLDHFKRFNDSYGHIAGDILLRELGLFLQRHIRGSDIACRYGGEEFTLILPDATLDVVRDRAEQLREDAKRLKVWHIYRWLRTVTLSLGVAVFPDHGATAKGILQAADAALYRAKQAGRDQVRVAENLVGLADPVKPELPLVGAAGAN
jgi:diguanylate cyclase (GGDEF)-like protein